MNRRQFLIGMSAVAGAAVEPAARAAAAADKPHVGVCIPSATHGWAGGVGWWAEQEVKRFPDVTWDLQRAGSAAEQAGQIDALVQKGVTGLAVLPFDSDTPLRPLRAAKEQQGVYLVVVDRGAAGADRRRVRGRRQQGLRPRGRPSSWPSKLGGKGSVVALRGLPVEIDAERFDAWSERHETA